MFALNLKMIMQIAILSILPPVPPPLLPVLLIKLVMSMFLYVFFM